MWYVNGRCCIRGPNKGSCIEKDLTGKTIVITGENKEVYFNCQTFVLHNKN